MNHARIQRDAVGLWRKALEGYPVFISPLNTKSDHICDFDIYGEYWVEILLKDYPNNDRMFFYREPVNAMALLPEGENSGLRMASGQGCFTMMIIGTYVLDNAFAGLQVVFKFIESGRVWISYWIEKEGRWSAFKRTDDNAFTWSIIERHELLDEGKRE